MPCQKTLNFPCLALPRHDLLKALVQMLADHSTEEKGVLS